MTGVLNLFLIAPRNSTDVSGGVQVRGGSGVGSGKHLSRKADHPRDSGGSATRFSVVHVILGVRGHPRA